MLKLGSYQTKSFTFENHPLADFNYSPISKSETFEPSVYVSLLQTISSK